MVRVDVKPKMLEWACGRAGLGSSDLARRLPYVDEWLRGERKPTLKQLERFAKAVHVPVGYLLLPKPPREELPIPDFRTMGGERISRPSPDLLETIYLCEQRQEWYRDYARSARQDPCAFVGASNIRDDPIETAAAIRADLRFSIAERRRMRSWQQALSSLVELADEMGVLVMVSGIVGNNTHRRLDPEEFRGFALCDDLAPVVFVNGADTKSGQMFTLVHELAHIRLGQSGISDIVPLSSPSDDVERWCNQVAAEVLVPIEDVRREYRATEDLSREVERLARAFKVSTLVILRRIHDAECIDREAMWAAYQRQLEYLLELPRSSGGDFYRTQPTRVSARLARALVSSTLEGQTLYRDAFHLLGVAKLTTFYSLGQKLGVV